MKTKILFLLLILSFSVTAQVKDNILDALKLQIDQAASDSIKIPLQIQLANHTRQFDIEIAKEILKDILQEIEGNDYNSAYYLKQKATVYNGLGECAQDQSDKANALHYYLKSVKITEKILDSIGMGLSYHNLGYLYYGKSDEGKAKEYTRKAIKIRQALGEEYSFDLAMTYNVLALGFQQFKQSDSAFYYFEKAKEVDRSKEGLIITNSNMAFLYTGQKKYDKAVPLFEESIKVAQARKEYKTLSSHYQNLGYIYRQLKEYDKAIELTDSAIFYAQTIGNKKQLENEYYSRHTIYKLKGDYKKAYEDYKLSITYLDSIHNVEELNRFTELDLKYQFEKEKEIAAIALKNEKRKKKVYLVFFILAVIIALLVLYLFRKNNKQKLILAQNKIALKEVEKLKTDLALATREKELKKVILKNSITEEVLNKTLDDIKEIITFENEKERKVALRSLSASLLSEKTSKASTTSLQNYLDKIDLDFKIRLDTHFPTLKPKEKELLSLIKFGLSTLEISKLLNTTLPAIKSSRYRIRKKLGLQSNDDIIAYIESKDSSSLNL